MNFIKQPEHPFPTTYASTNRFRQAFAAACIATLYMLASPAMATNELFDQDWQATTTQMSVLTWSEQSIEPELPRPRSRLLEHGHLRKVEEEAKIRAQSQYLAEKFGQRESTIREYVELAWQEASRRDGLAPELLIAMMQKESAFRPKVQSRYGAQGLMQVVRRWHHDKLQPSESLFDPAVNIRVGADVLEEYLEKADGSLGVALKQYSGNARGYANTVLKASSKLARLAAEAASAALASRG